MLARSLARTHARQLDSKKHVFTRARGGIRVIQGFGS